MKKIILGVCASILFCLQVVSARSFADIYTECGLGSMIAPNNSAVAAVTNVTWDSGTTAISSNISSPDLCKGGEGRIASFINDAYELLETDLASGSGKHLDMLAAMVLQDRNEQNSFKKSLRADFAKVVAARGYLSKKRFEKAQTLYNLVYKNLNS